MNKNKREKSSYYVLDKYDKLELKTQKYKIISNTAVAASGILMIAIACLSSNTMFTDGMTAIDLISIVFGGGASYIGSISAGKAFIDYNVLKEELYEAAEKKGRSGR